METYDLLELYKFWLQTTIKNSKTDNYDRNMVENNVQTSYTVSNGVSRVHFGIRGLSSLDYADKTTNKMLSDLIKMSNGIIFEVENRMPISETPKIICRPIPRFERMTIFDAYDMATNDPDGCEVTSIDELIDGYQVHMWYDNTAKKWTLSGQKPIGKDRPLDNARSMGLFENIFIPDNIKELSDTEKKRNLTHTFLICGGCDGRLFPYNGDQSVYLPYLVYLGSVDNTTGQISMDYTLRRICMTGFDYTTINHNGGNFFELFMAAMKRSQNLMEIVRVGSKLNRFANIDLNTAGELAKSLKNNKFWADSNHANHAWKFTTSPFQKWLAESSKPVTDIQYAGIFVTLKNGSTFVVPDDIFMCAKRHAWGINNSDDAKRTVVAIMQGIIDPVKLQESIPDLRVKAALAYYQYEVARIEFEMHASMMPTKYEFTYSDWRKFRKSDITLEIQRVLNCADHTTEIENMTKSDIDQYGTFEDDRIYNGTTVRRDVFRNAMAKHADIPPLPSGFVAFKSPFVI